MPELEIIENKFTIPLDLAEPPLDVRKGWNETIARKLGNATRMREHPRPSRSDATERWQEWHNAAPRSIYTLGRCASLLAVASFHESTFTTTNMTAPHKLEFFSYDETGRDYLAAFLRAAHHDLHNSREATWTELDPDGDTSTHLYSSIDYTRIPSEPNRYILVRNAETP